MRRLITLGAVLAVLWIAPALLPVESGLKFGLPYRVFFSAIAIFGGLWFYLLRIPPTPPLNSPSKALASIVLVFLLSIGAIVLLANLAPQFAFERKSVSAATAEERGKALFNDAKAGCFLCHTVAGSGGTRGSDLSHIGTVAGNQKPGMSVDDYLKESLLEPGIYVVPPFENIMPPIAQHLSSGELSDLLAYLKGLK